MNRSHAVGCLLGFLVLSSLAIAQQNKPTEKELIAVLQSSETPDAEKALACKKLAVCGSPASVPVLAPMLADERFSSWARIPLEVIPGDEADAAFREAARTLTGRQLIGTINSIGVRRDVNAVGILGEHLSSDDEDISNAAAVALGRIGNESAAKKLQVALSGENRAVRNAAADGTVLCAERLMRDGNQKLSIDLYDQVRNADVLRQRVLEATRGAILARENEGIPLLVEQLKSEDRDFYGIGLFTARELGGTEATKALVELVGELSPQRQPALMLAIADRGDNEALPDVMLLAMNAAPSTRLAAMRAIEKLGDATCVDALLTASLESDANIAAAAKQAIEKMTDEKVNTELVSRLASATGKAKVNVIEMIGKRRVEAYVALRQAAEAKDGDVRRAALMALGQTIRLENIGFLVSQFESPASAEDGKVAARALRDAAVRMPDLDEAATKLSGSLSNGSEDSKETVLKILGEMGGAKALQTLGKTARSGSPRLQDTASRLLGEWMTVDASSELMNLAKRPGPYQVRALRGYIRLARQFPMPAEQRTEMCRSALQVATRDEERKLVLGVLQRYADLGNLNVAAEVARSPTLKEEAVKAVEAIAKKVGADKPEVKSVLTAVGISSK